MSTAFSKEEKAAMRAAVAEAKAAQASADLEAACVAAIEGLSGDDRIIAKRFHELVAENTQLKPKTWYGMPAYYNEQGKTVVFLQPAAKFKYRHATIGFQEDANLDEGGFWPTSWAVTKLTATEEKRLIALLKQAVS